MPTEYTADVKNGKITELSEFALRCARAFGALIMMRDEPMDATIPDEFKPDSYYIKALADAREELAKVRALSPAECEAEAKKFHKQQVQARKERRERYRVEYARYKAMLDKVRAWRPPTPDHVSLKTFMIEQLSDSLRFDCGDDDKRVETLTGQEWFERRTEELSKSIARYEGEVEQERLRAESRTAWVRALRKSLEHCQTEASRPERAEEAISRSAAQ